MDEVGLARGDRSLDPAEARQSEADLGIGGHRQGGEIPGERKSNRAPSRAAAAAVCSSERTTPLTCGRQASVATRIFASRPACADGHAMRPPQRRQQVAAPLAPADDLEAAVVVLDDGGAAFHPVAGVEVARRRDRDQRGVVDVAADHAVDAVAPRLARQHLLERPMKLTAFLTLTLAQAESDQ